jgi:hypothetical protein
MTGGLLDSDLGFRSGIQIWDSDLGFRSGIQIRDSDQGLRSGIWELENLGT